MVGVFLAVAAVVLGATAATGRGARPTEAPAAAAVQFNPAADPAANPQGAGDQPSDGLLSKIPDTSLAAGDEALRTRPGVLVAEGDKLRIEKVPLTAPATVSVRGATVTVDSVYRITITAGPYAMRDMPAIVSIDNRPLAIGGESADLASLVAFTFDDSVVTSGATVAVSYGLPDQTTTVWSTTLEVVQ